MLTKRTFNSAIKRIAAAAGLLATILLPVARADLATVATQIDSLRRERHIAAASVVLVDRYGLLLHKTFGVVTRDGSRAADNDTLFRVGSITKTYTSLALLRAEAAGVLRLDQPIRERLPQAPFENRWETTQPLTLAELMEHSAGWFDMSTAEFDSSDPTPLSLPQALALRPASRRSQWPPGLHSEYSNSGPGLAAWVLEQHSKKPFETVLQASVFEPLGMRSASLLRDAATRARLAQGYDRDGATPIPYWHVLYRAAAGLNLNPRDMAPMLRMLLNRGRVGDQRFLTPEQVLRMEHPRTTLAARAGLDYGYGLGIEQSLHQGHLLFGHSGDADGTVARFDYSLESGRGYFVVITAYQNETLAAMQEPLNDWLVEGLPAAVAPATAALTGEQLQALTGDYQPASIRFPTPGWQRQRLQVLLRDGQLLTRDSAGDERALLAVDARRFRRPWETLATMAFISDAAGELVLQGPMGNWRRLR